MTKGSVTNDGICRQKWQRPFTKRKYAVATKMALPAGIFTFFFQAAVDLQHKPTEQATVQSSCQVVAPFSCRVDSLLS